MGAATTQRGKEVKEPVVRADKIELVGQVAEWLRQAQGVVLADFQGLTVADMNVLRSRLRSDSVQFRVIKNRLLKRALVEAGCDGMDEILVGNTAVAFGNEDATAPARLLSQYTKENERLRIKGGLLEGRRIDLAQIQELASMPGRLELLSMLARDMKQPATKIAVAMQAALLKVAYAMQALARKKQEAGETATGAAAG
jgi:large subunit ribosomal protein L10